VMERIDLLAKIKELEESLFHKERIEKNLITDIDSLRNELVRVQYGLPSGFNIVQTKDYKDK